MAGLHLDRMLAPRQFKKEKKNLYRDVESVKNISGLICQEKQN